MNWSTVLEGLLGAAVLGLIGWVYDQGKGVAVLGQQVKDLTKRVDDNDDNNSEDIKKLTEALQPIPALIAELRAFNTYESKRIDLIEREVFPSRNK